MARIEINKSDIPLKAFLRADPHSQHFCFKSNNTELVDEAMFWGKGTDGSDGLYLNYKNIRTRSISISEGVLENYQRLYETECDEWIENNLLCNVEQSKMYVISGYAGCGKTTFINHIIRKDPSRYIYIDIGKEWSYPTEPSIFFYETLNTFSDKLRIINSYTYGQKKRIWKKFNEIGADPKIGEIDVALPSCFVKIKKILNNSKPSELRNNIIYFLHDYLHLPDRNKNQVWHNCGQTQTLVALIILLNCAELSVNTQDSKPYSLVFDNLDIITDPTIPAENIILLSNLLDRYVKFCDNYYLRTNKRLPSFKIIFTVRKVLYSHIVSQLPDLEMPSEGLTNCLNICDISELYNSVSIIRHRIAYWQEHIRNDDNLAKKLGELKELLSFQDNANLEEENENEIEDAPPEAINFDAFLNHNYRAFSNIISAFLDNSVYYKIITPLFHSPNRYEGWQKVALIIFSLSFLYRKEGVWSAMGFGCKDFEITDYPTTLNRLILNQLYLARRKQTLFEFANDIKDLPEEYDTSLKGLIEKIYKVHFTRIKIDSDKNQIDSQRNVSNDSDMQKMIISRLADMCARNPASIHSKAYGYDSDEDEHWRRPLYFIGGVKLSHTAASFEELKTFFQSCFSDGSSQTITFSITDEGFVLIRDIVPNFEFYSARYCQRDFAIPLYQAKSKDDLDRLIAPVFSSIEKCCSRNILLMEEYTEKYGIGIDKYLRQFFHPRTRIRFKKNHGIKVMDPKSFRPQLHIVRVIFSHIGYFNKVKHFFFESSIDERNEMCKCLTFWIERYMQLYSSNFYSILKDTVCHSDNNVFLQLRELLDQQEAEYAPGGSMKNVDIAIAWKGNT